MMSWEGDMSEYSPDSEELVTSDTEEDLKEPPMFKVLLHNDNYTTMEFVVEILMGVFQKPIAEATRIMLNVHRKGIGVCGSYTRDVAETKVDTVHLIARENGFPLKCSMEEE
jgi:ATP-dependent Clp protease adaptor protein ClpS